MCLAPGATRTLMNNLGDIYEKIHNSIEAIINSTVVLFARRSRGDACVVFVYTRGCVLCPGVCMTRAFCFQLVSNYRFVCISSTVALFASYKIISLNISPSITNYPPCNSLAERHTCAGSAVQTRPQ